MWIRATLEGREKAFATTEAALEKDIKRLLEQYPGLVEHPDLAGVPAVTINIDLPHDEAQIERIASW